MPLMDKLPLRKQSLIETVNDQLKNICQIEHARHLSVANFLGDPLAALLVYTYQEKKSLLGPRHDQLATLGPAILQPALRRTQVI